MAGFNYYVFWAPASGGGGGIGTQLSNVQSFHTFRGRQGSLDPISAGTFVVTIMNPQQSPVVGDYIFITTSTTPPSPDEYVMSGQITDIQYQYYNQSITAGDMLTITGIDFLGLVMNGNVTGTTSSAKSGVFLDATLSTAGLGPFYSADTGLSTCSTQIYDNTPLSDALNAIQNTERGHMWNRPMGNSLLYFRARGNYTAQTVTFDPTTNSSTKQIYQELVFQSATTEVFSRFTVSPAGLTAQTYPNSPGTNGAKTATLSTYDVSTAQALNNATAAAAMYGSTGNRIKSVTCFDKAQTTQKLNVFDVNDQVTVNWRSTNYTGIIEGIEVSASPNGAYYTFYLSAEETMDYLILNNAVFGKLDNNKLGF